jgi:hypothetical protein
MAINSYHLNAVERDLFSENLRAAMAERQLTTVAVARGLRLKNTSQVKLWVSGAGVPSPDLLNALAEWLRISPNQLLPNGAATRVPARQYVKVNDHGGGVTVEIRVSTKDLASVRQLIECAERLGVRVE